MIMTIPRLQIIYSIGSSFVRGQRNIKFWPVKPKCDWSNNQRLGIMNHFYQTFTPWCLSETLGWSWLEHLDWWSCLIGSENIIPPYHECVGSIHSPIKSTLTELDADSEYLHHIQEHQESRSMYDKQFCTIYQWFLINHKFSKVHELSTDVCNSRATH